MKKIYYNGNIITMENEESRAEAIYVVDGVIKVIGSEEEVMKNKASDVELVDLENKTMMPSFYDGHSHFGKTCEYSLLPTLSLPPVGSVTKIDDMIEILSKTINDYSYDEPQIASGYDIAGLEEYRHPTKFDLDLVSTTIPIIVVHASGHMGVLNSCALEKFNITSESKDPVGGEISRIDGSNEPSGLLKETAFMPILFASAKAPKGEIVKEMGKKGIEMYVSNGITTVQDGFTCDGDYEFLLDVQEKVGLDIDVKMYPPVSIHMSPSKLTDGTYGLKPYDTNEMLKFSGYKLFLDGSPQGRTAWVTEPYLNPNETEGVGFKGIPTFSDDTVVFEACKKAIEEDVQLLVHCNGDAAADQFINAYEHALKVCNKTPEESNVRPVVVHAQLVRADQLDRMKKLNIHPSFFSVHAFYWGDEHIKNFGLERAQVMSNMKYANKIGLSYTDHQDTPVVPPNVIFSVWAAVNRTTRSGVKLGNTVTPFQALQAYTTGAAYQYFEEDIKGTLEVGKYADFVILSDDVLNVEYDNIKDIEVIETIRRGKTLYKK